MRKSDGNNATWGGWRLDADSSRLVLQSGAYHYEIGLEQISDSKNVLEWIIQLRMKEWVTNDIIGDLVSAFLDLFGHHLRAKRRAIQAEDNLYHTLQGTSLGIMRNPERKPEDSSPLRF